MGPLWLSASSSRLMCRGGRWNGGRVSVIDRDALLSAVHVVWFTSILCWRRRAPGSLAVCVR